MVLDDLRIAWAQQRLKDMTSMSGLRQDVPQERQEIRHAWRAAARGGLFALRVTRRNTSRLFKGPPDFFERMQLLRRKTYIRRVQRLVTKDLPTFHVTRRG